MALTNSLEDSYESFIISLDSTPTHDLMLAYIVDRLLNDEMRRGNKGVKKEEGEEEKKGGTLYMAKSEKVCWGCGKPRHLKSQCREG